MKSRTKKRLALLVVLALVVGVGGVVLVSLRDARRAAALERAYAEGMAAHEAGDHEVAVQRLSTFVGRDKSDDEALLSFAESIREAPGPNRNRLGTAINTMRLLIDREDGVGPGHELLLDLYADAGQVSELEVFAGEVLAKEPDHLKAASLRVAALMQLARGEEAVTVASDIAEWLPNETGAHALYFTAAANAEVERSVIEERARSLASREGGPDGVRLIGARALAAAGDVSGAADVVADVLAGEPWREPGVLELAVELSDMLGSEREGLAEAAREAMSAGLLSEAAPRLRMFALERAWKRADWATLSEVGSQAIGSPGEASDREVGVLAAAAAAGELRASGSGARSSLADRLMEELERRVAEGSVEEGDGAASDGPGGSAAKWLVIAQVSELFRERALGEAREMLEPIADARGDLAEQTAAFYEGLLLSDVGESAASVAALRQLAQEPSWRRARHALAIVHRGRGENTRAVAVLLSEPTLNQWPEGVRLLLEAAIGRASEAGASDGDRAFATELAEEYARVLGPTEEADALRARALLASGQVERARRVAEELIARDLAGSDSSFALAEALRDPLPELSDRLFDKLESAGGGSFAASIRRVEAMVGAGEIDAAVAELGRIAERAPDEPSRARAEVRRAQLVAAGDAAEGRALFLEASERYPNLAFVHTAALESEAVWADPETVGGPIDRLRRLSGEDGIAWRVFDARRRLLNDADEGVASEVLIELSAVLQREPENARALLAAVDAAERLGDREAVIEYLERVVAADERFPAVYPRLIGALQSSGRLGDASRYLAEFLEMELNSLALRRQRATLLGRQGMHEDALEEWRALADEGALGDRLAYAGALLRAGEVDAARSELDGMLSSGVAIPPRERIALAELLARTGRPEEGRRVLDGLPGAGAWGTRDGAIGAYLMTIGDAEGAREYLARDVEAAPSDSEAVMRLVRAHLAVGDRAAALSAAERGLRASPDDAALSAVRSALGEDAGGEAPVRLFAAMTRTSTASDGTASEALGRLLDGYLSGRTSLAAFERGLSEYLSSNPTGYIAWRLLMEVRLAAGDAQGAAEAMREAAALFAGDARPARDAAELLLAIGEANAAVVMAERWRARAAEGEEAPEVFLAEALLGAGDSDGAAALLSDYASRVGDGDAMARRIAVLLFVALAGEGRVADAAAVLDRADVSGGVWLAALARAAQSLPAARAAAGRPWLERAERMAESLGGGNGAVAAGWYALAERTGDAADFERVISLTSAAEMQDRPGMMTMRGASMLALGRMDDAERAFRAAMDAGGDSPDLLNNLSFVIVERGGEAEEAASLARRAIEAAEAAAIEGDRLREYYDTLGLAELAGENYAAAERAFREGLAIDPSAAHLRLGLAEALVGSGDPEEARTILSRLSDEGVPERLRSRLESVRGSLGVQ